MNFSTGVIIDEYLLL